MIKIWKIIPEKGFPIHLMRTVKSMYQNTRTTIIIRKGTVNGSTPIEINRGGQQDALYH